MAGKTLSERFTGAVKKAAGITGDSTMTTLKKNRKKKEQALCEATDTCKKLGVSATVNGK